jgi:hypothetical protein
VVSGPPPGLVSLGGYRFAACELTRIINDLDPSATLSVQPDALTGQRLAGTATNQEAVRMALQEMGANPLLVEAFGAEPETDSKTNSKTDSKADSMTDGGRRSA